MKSRRLFAGAAPTCAVQNHHGAGGGFGLGRDRPEARLRTRHATTSRRDSSPSVGGAYAGPPRTPDSGSSRCSGATSRESMRTRVRFRPRHRPRDAWPCAPCPCSSNQTSSSPSSSPRTAKGGSAPHHGGRFSGRPGFSRGFASAAAQSDRSRRRQRTHLLIELHAVKRPPVQHAVRVPGRVTIEVGRQRSAKRSAKERASDSQGTKRVRAPDSARLCLHDALLDASECSLSSASHQAEPRGLLERPGGGSWAPSASISARWAARRRRAHADAGTCSGRVARSSPRVRADSAGRDDRARRRTTESGELRRAHGTTNRTPADT